MDWARDQLGKLIHACERALFSYALLCPTCGEPVRLRAGLQRRAHFAHFSHRARPECENYHPSLGTGQQRLRKDQTPLNVASIHGGLYLERKARGRYLLYLKLPRLSEGPQASGEIEIRSSLGVRTYSQMQLRRRHLVPLVPKIPLLEVFGAKEVAEAVSAIRQDISCFREYGNYFRATQVGGRLLAPVEPLEWGERYLVLSRQPPPPPPRGLLVEPHTEAHGWYFFDVALPAVESVDSNQIREAIEQFVGRPVENRRPHLYVVDPPPHHIELDGTCVFPTGIDRIVLVRTSSCQVSIDEQPSIEKHWAVGEIGPDWCDITGPGKGEFWVLMNGRQEIAVRFEACDLFQPRGVRLIAGDRALEIFEIEGADEIVHGQSPLRIECPSFRVADQLVIDGDALIRDTRTFTLRQPIGRLSVAASNFGRLRLPSGEETHAAQGSTDHEVDPQRVWIEGLLSLSSPFLASFSKRSDQYGTRGWNFDQLGLLPHIRSVFRGRS